MKAIVLFFLFFSMTAQAVVTKDCPETVSISLDKMYHDSIVDEDAWGDDSRFPYDGYNGPGIIRLQEKLKALGTLSLELKLTRKARAVCYYRGKDQNGDYTAATLFGSTRENAQEPATLKIYAVGSLAVYLGIKEVATTGLSPRGKFAGLYYRGEYCSWGDCIPDHIQIGSTKFTLQ